MVTVIKDLVCVYARLSSFSLISCVQSSATYHHCADDCSWLGHEVQGCIVWDTGMMPTGDERETGGNGQWDYRTWEIQECEMGGLQLRRGGGIDRRDIVCSDRYDRDGDGHMEERLVWSPVPFAERAGGSDGLQSKYPLRHTGNLAAVSEQGLILLPNMEEEVHGRARVLDLTSACFFFS